MIDKADDAMPKMATQETFPEADNAEARRAILRKLGRFAGVTAPAVTLLLAAAAKPDRVQAAS